MDEQTAERHGFRLQEDSVWMPIRTIPLNEGKVAQVLQEMRIPCYLPLVKRVRVQNVDRGGRSYCYKREVRRPMFPSYLFARIAMVDRGPLWATRSIRKFLTVSKEREPAFLDELHAVRMMERLGEDSELEFAPELQPGDFFVIESGPWTGVYGQLHRKEKLSRWSVYLETVGTTVSATIDPSKYKFRKMD